MKNKNVIHRMNDFSLIYTIHLLFIFEILITKKDKFKEIFNQSMCSKSYIRITKN